MTGRYSLREAAERVGVHKLTLYRWEKERKIPAVKRLARNKERIFTDEDIEVILSYKNKTVEPE